MVDKGSMVEETIPPPPVLVGHLMVETLMGTSLRPLGGYEERF